tara:strand:+ start:312 stop:476 length:165 start_codon:yes stop_codon:yes gene_type:complete
VKEKIPQEEKLKSTWKAKRSRLSVNIIDFTASGGKIQSDTTGEESEQSENRFSF